MSVLACLTDFRIFKRWTLWKYGDFLMFKITVVRYLIFEKLLFPSIYCIQSGRVRSQILLQQIE